MAVLLMGLLGALVAVALLVAIAALRGIRLYPEFEERTAAASHRLTRLLLWAMGGFFAGMVVWLTTNWPVAGLWVFVGVMSIPLLRGSGPTAKEEVALVEAIASWTEQIRDTMASAAGLQQALLATTMNPTPVLEDPLRNFAARARRGSLVDALTLLGREVNHPSCDLVVAALSNAARMEGARMGPLLTRLSESIREEARMRVRVEVGRARIRVSMRIVGVMMGVSVLVLALSSTGFLQAYETGGGQFWLIVVGMVVVASVWSTRIMSEIPLPERFVARDRSAS